MEREPLLVPSPVAPGNSTVFSPTGPPRPSATAAPPTPTSSTAASPKRPTLVNLEGGDWLLTTLLITLDAVLLELYQSENTRWATFLTWFRRYECDSGWVCELLNTLFIMAVAVVNVTLLIPVINVNVRTPSKRSWRGWLLFAWAGLLLVDAMTVLQVQDSVRKCLNQEDDIESWTAHFWLIAMAVLLSLSLNVRFVHLYGWLTCFACDGEQALKKTEGLRQIHLNATRRRRHRAHTEARRQMHANAQSLLNVVRAPQLHRFNTGEFLEQVATGFRQFVGRKVRLVRTSNLNISHFSEDGSGDLQEHMHRLLDVDYITTWKARILGKIKHMYTEVAEVENVFEYSSWIKAAAIFAVLMLIYNCIKTTEILFNLASSWDDYHELAIRFQDGLSSARASLSDLDRNLTEISGTTYEEGTVTAVANETLPAVVQDVSELQDILTEFDKTTGSAYDVAGAILDVALLTTARLVNITDLKDNHVVSAFFYVDSIIPILKYTCIIGYPIGTFIGLHSLYQVLVQHKRMSLALEQALSSRSLTLMGKQDVSEEDARETLLGIEKKYEIGGAVYFFGILMSTAVVQQHIFGFFITLSVAVIVDLKNFDVLLNIGGYLIFVYLAVMITNLFLTHVIGDRLLTKQGFQIQHPWLFFLYLFTFSMIHAVLGFLYALWRALLLLVTTFWVLNRLDVSLFLTGKQFDNGHYSFMSMLLLTRVIRLTNIAQGHIQSPNSQHQETLSDSGTSGELPPQVGSRISSEDMQFWEEDEKEDSGKQSNTPQHLPLSYDPQRKTVVDGEIETNEETESNLPSVNGENHSISIRGEGSIPFV